MLNNREVVKKKQKKTCTLILLGIVAVIIVFVVFEIFASKIETNAKIESEREQAFALVEANKRELIEEKAKFEEEKKTLLNQKELAIRESAKIKKENIAIETANKGLQKTLDMAAKSGIEAKD